MKTFSLKEFGLTALLAVGAALVSAPAYAATVDAVIASTSDKLNENETRAFIETSAGLAAGSLTYTKIENNSGWTRDTNLSGNAIVGDPGETGPLAGFTFDINPLQPGYFVLKFGGGGKSVDSLYVFENIGDLSTLAFGDVQVGNISLNKQGNPDIGRLSHYGYTDSISVMPLPAGGILILTGLGALAFARRCKKRSV